MNRRHLYLALAGIAVVAAGIGLWTQSTPNASHPPRNDSAQQESGAPIPAHHDPGFDEPTIEPGKPSTAQEFYEDSRKGVSPNQPPGFGGSVDTGDLDATTTP
ncbi:hypothetical protein DFR76_101836 [Nocardia pseudobrasiliensis]|uniref:Uncharacterized protein n=1 Tax=Nocardia pseudobrasiliensis TaxID=45979 RepID=A0A370IEZ7_9NOCA|nr:hypothetical protein DFR76_101836 [Nocardia pseudobrasiliensis]